MIFTTSFSRKTLGLLIILHTSIALALLPEVETTQPLNSASAEVKALQENDSDIKRRYEIKDQFIKNMLNSVDKAYLIESKNGFLNKAAYYFFLNIFPGGIIEASLEDGVILLSETQAPQLHATIKKLCDKMNMPKPAIFLDGNKDLFNACAASLTHNFSMIIIGEKLLHKLSQEELESVLAHELAHIQKSHVPKLLTVSVVSAATIIATIVLMFQQQKVVINNPALAAQLEAEIKRAQDQKSVFTSTPFILGTGATMLIAVSLLQNYLSRGYEKEADMTSIEITENPEAFLHLIEKIEAHVDEEFATFEKDYNFLHEKIELLRTQHPKHAGYLDFFAQSYYEGKKITVNSYKEGNASTHPSTTERKRYAQELIDNKKSSVSNIPVAA